MIKKLEDIYPLTIVHMKHGKFAVVEGFSTFTCVKSLEQNEEWQYDPGHYMSTEWGHINYGVGRTVAEAFQNFNGY
jgi:hypothetical protein